MTHNAAWALLGAGCLLLGYGLGVLHFADRKYLRLGGVITAAGVLVIAAGWIIN